ncbi:GNAT family N-acetyltransferase [Salinimonas lutimaris]|uniref:GNAT family N-acetyltransferase n=1 Tax=Salinimonas lutimaris TaxID=914153 RepID=UPI0010BFEE66|nr:GNAT family N-acetyltransferase [Salinimonas lutimaris]
MVVEIRKATPQDGAQAVPLLLESGRDLLVSIFGLGSAKRASDFLHDTWARRQGQYGSDNHWVATYDNNIAGLITSWHDGLPADFDRQTLASVTEFYGIDTAMDVVMRSQQVTVALNPPEQLELGIGHLAVNPVYQRAGIGSMLMRFMEQQALELKKLALVLDVHRANTGALQFYSRHGFEVRQTLSAFIQMGKGIAPAT